MQIPTVLILAGGLGTRLHPLTETVPKVLVPVLGRPFLEHLLRELRRQGARRFVLSVGHMADQVTRWLGDGSSLGLDQVRYVREQTPLGTGGAIRRALSSMEQTVVVANGDTLLELDLRAMVGQHHQAKTPATLAVARVADRGRYGAVQVEQGRVVRFEEKKPGAGPGLINGGVCVIDRQLFDGTPPAPFSFERDLLPHRLGEIAAFETRGFFVDIGTHEALTTVERDLADFFARQ